MVKTPTGQTTVLYGLASILFATHLFALDKALLHDTVHRTSRRLVACGRDWRLLIPLSMDNMERHGGYADGGWRL
jgi:hypothetical protein